VVKRRFITSFKVVLVIIIIDLLFMMVYTSVVTNKHLTSFSNIGLFTLCHNGYKSFELVDWEEISGHLSHGDMEGYCYDLSELLPKLL